MRTISLVGLVVAVLISGCFGGDDHTALKSTFCPDGSQVHPENLPGHHEEDFNATALCPATPPSVILQVPESVVAYHPVALNWAVTAGDVPNAHAMLSSVRFTQTVIPEDQLYGPESYGVELARREHQAVPNNFTATANFEAVGSYFLRAYATINNIDYWSNEVTLNVTAVLPTDVVHDFTHAAGGVLGDMTPTELAIALGDSVRFVNDDLVAHTFSFTGGPLSIEPITVAAMASSEPIALLQPGGYEVSTDDVQAKIVTIQVDNPPPS